MLLAELLDFIAPGIRRQHPERRPPWPPDAFGIAATVLRRSGAYARLVELAKSQGRLLPSTWPAEAAELGQTWRDGFSEAHGKAMAPSLPAVDSWWATLLEAARQGATIERVVLDDTVCRAVLCLSLVADEASAGIGLREDASRSGFEATAAYRLLINRFESLGWELEPSRICVLPKQHTPQRGMTLRSLSHHLALLPASDVRVNWHPRIHRERDPRLLNLLLVPWPEEVRASDFHLVGTDDADGSCLPPRYRYFTYERAVERRSLFEANLRRIVEESRTVVSHLDGVVFPELSLTWRDYETAAKLAHARRLLLVAGVGLRSGERKQKAPTNVCAVRLPDGTEFVQRKHHRWCLDRNQILQYGLGGVIPASCDAWELTEIGERRLSFATLGWMTLAALICEDLARQDPVAEILRAVGPNLVIALLMDGPQLRARWSARYASVLAEDPGCSVLTLTSLGMAARSRAVRQEESRPRVIGLWRDVMHGEQELELPEGCTAAVLSLSRESIEEFSADGRGDRGVSHFPVFAGFHPLKITDGGKIPRSRKKRGHELDTAR